MTGLVRLLIRRDQSECDILLALLCCLADCLIVDLVKRRQTAVDLAGVNKLRHKAVEKGQQKCTDMGSVYVGIGQDDDLIITELTDIKIVANAAAESGDS